MIESIVQFLIKGGVFMIPLGFCSLISFAIILERGFALREKNILQAELMHAIDTLRIGQATDAIEHYALTGRTTLSRLVRTCLEHLPWSKSENVEAVQTKARGEVIEMERGLLILEVCTGIAPLLGLLGTVAGLVSIFEGLGSSVNLASEGTVLARGIAEALNTTVAGLVIAIPCLIAHSYYTKKIEGMATQLESVCMDLLAKLYLQNNGS